jgi:hypothetical protein
LLWRPTIRYGATEPAGHRLVLLPRWSVLRLNRIPGLEWISAILSVVAVLLVLGGLAWIAWGWWKSLQTDEGDVGPVIEHDAPDAVLA